MPNLELALRNLARHRTRTFISLSAIAFGVVALLLTGGFIEWIFWAIREAAIQTGLGHVQITRPAFRGEGFANPTAYVLPNDAAELDRLRTISSIKALDQRLMLSGLVSSGETTLAFTAEAVDPEADAVISKVLAINGDKLTSSDASGVLLGQGLAAALRVKQGDKVTLMVALPRGGINAVDAHVRGLYTTEVKALDDSVIRMPLPLARQLLRVKGAHVWVLALDSTDKTEGVMAALKQSLPANQFEIMSWYELSDFYRKSVVLLSRQVDAVTILIGVIILLGISNTLTMNVLERTGEIGTLMALGIPRKHILGLFVLEGSLLGACGGLSGLLLGFGLAQLLSWIGIPMPPPPGRNSGYSAEIMLTPWLAFGAFAMAVIATTLASLYPAFKASRLPIVDALRHNR